MRTTKPKPPWLGRVGAVIERKLMTEPLERLGGQWGGEGVVVPIQRGLPARPPTPTL